ncbi:hypothetical protein JCM16303_002452 [Sporobolomyces ruberrimus]
MANAGVSNGYSSYRNDAALPAGWKQQPSEIDRSALPDFPLLSSDMRVQALRHKSIATLVSLDSEHPLRVVRDELGSNKKWALIGAAEARACLSRIMVARYPRKTCEGITGMVDVLLRQQILSALTSYYGFFDASTLAETIEDARCVYNMQKQAAGLFEAWLGAVSCEKGRNVAFEWLNSLFSTKVFGNLEQFVLRIQNLEMKQAMIQERAKRARQASGPNNVCGPGGSMQRISKQPRHCYIWSRRKTEGPTEPTEVASRCLESSLEPSD